MRIIFSGMTRTVPCVNQMPCEGIVVDLCGNCGNDEKPDSAPDYEMRARSEGVTNFYQ